MKEREEEPRRDLLLILLIVPLGVLCMFLAGQAATRFSPTWSLESDMGSGLDPDSEFASLPVPNLIEPIDANILTQPVWGDLFLTPNAIIPTSVPPTQAPTLQVQPTTQPTLIVPTTNPTPIPSPTTIVLPPPTKPPPPPPPPTPPPPPASANLGITKDDGIASYIRGTTVQYTIVASNAGPNDVTGATVTDIFDTTRLSNITWTCAAAGGASCTASGTGNINDTVDLPAGASVTYTVDADINSSSSGDLVNTASISHGSISDPDTSDNSASDTDTENTEPDIGPPDGSYYVLPDGSSVTYLLSTPISADGSSTPDLVYYEALVQTPPLPPEVLMDWVVIEISVDQVTWYTVFFWGDCAPPDPPGPPGTCTADTNTNVNINIIGGYESDNRSFDPATLYNSSGVTIDIDPIPGILTGVDYTYIRITAPIVGGSNGYGDGLTVDAIQPYFP
jgi:uncharacterized repeat protein (TIGR01451 family)